MERKLNFEFYVILNAVKKSYGYVVGNVPRVTKSKPSLGENEIAVKISLNVDERHFSKPTLEIVGDVDFLGKEKERLNVLANEAATIVGEMLDLKINVVE